MSGSHAGYAWISARVAVLLLALNWLGACRQTAAPASSPPAPMPAAGQVRPVTPNPPPPSPAPAPAVSEPPPPTSPTPAAPPAAAAPVQSTPRKPSPPKPAPATAAAPVAKRPAAAPTPSAAPAQGALAVATARAEPKPAAPALDLAALEQRLRDTKAIGVFTKLSLKNQVDDLLDEVRQYHRNPANPPQPVVRRQFEGLMLKVLSSLQGGDPQLADSIAASREALWAILMDPDKFSKI